MNRSKRFLAMWVCALMLVGCKSGGGGKIGYVRTPMPVEEKTANDQGFATFWSRDLSVETRDQLTHAVQIDELIFTLEQPSNFLTAISIRDGKIIWRRAIGTSFERFYRPQRHGEEILINSVSQLYHLSIENGDTLYVTHIDHPVNHAPALTNRFAIFGSADGNVFAHHLHSGFKQWDYDMPGQVLVSPVISGFNVVAADSAGYYAILNSATGVSIRKERTFGPITASPAVAGAIYIPSDDQKLYAIDSRTGRLQWNYIDKGPLRQTPVPLGNYVFVPLSGGGLVALDSANGQNPLWRLEQSAIPVRIEGNLLLLRMEQSLRWVELADGSTISEVSTVPLKATIPGPNGSLILISKRGHLQRIDPLN